MANKEEAEKALNDLEESLDNLSMRANPAYIEVAEIKALYDDENGKLQSLSRTVSPVPF